MKKTNFLFQVMIIDGNYLDSQKKFMKYFFSNVIKYAVGIDFKTQKTSFSTICFTLFEVDYV